MQYLTPEAIKVRKTEVNELIMLCKKVIADTKLRTEADRLKLAELGYSLLDETGDCPLCDTNWQPGKLATHIESKIAAGKAASNVLDAISKKVDVIIDALTHIRPIIQKLLDAAVNVDDTHIVSLLTAWQGRTINLIDALDHPISETNISLLSDSNLPELGFYGDDLSALTQMLENIKKSTPVSSLEQTAWDFITRIEVHIGLWMEAQNTATKSKAIQERGNLLVNEFEKARDSVLSKLYDAINDRFVELYRTLHKTDESSFSAILKPEKAGLTFLVNFFGKGHHPPHALHSEGHQDSRGICLYLALAEYLNSGVIDLIILDDVVMSVDSGHRHELCRMIAEKFPDKQFVITTHDRAWAGQLWYNGAVKPNYTFTFSNWTVEYGPCVNKSEDMWTTIQNDLACNNIHRAAHALRHGVEGFMR